MELIFRLAIPASNPPHAYFDPKDESFKYDVNGPRTGIYTGGNFAQVRGKWRVNQAGWISDIEYVRDGRDKSLVAIIGDSFVAGLRVDIEDNFATQLRRQLGGILDVYSFGTSGAPLSQYLHMSRFVTKQFDPDVLVFNVVHNDFDESLCDIRQNLGMMCLWVDGENVVESEIVPYTPSPLRRLARRSSLVRYLFLNLNLSARLPGLDRGVRTQPSQPTDAESQAILQKRMERAAEYVLTAIARENPGRTIVFMADGPRRFLYDDNFEELAESDLWKNRLLSRIARQSGFYFIDLTGWFRQAFKETSARFESNHDYHWNEYGHAIAAEALADTLRTIISTKR